MSKSIWKFEIKNRINSIAVPNNAKILTIQCQFGSPCMWFLVDPSEFKVRRNFQIFGTGWDLPDDPGEYIGTYQENGGSFIWHVFEFEA